jgi:large subunit ribosomal protein L15
LDVLKLASVIRFNTKFVKVFLHGTINKAVTLKGIKVTKGARALIEAQGGRVEA